MSNELESFVEDEVIETVETTAESQVTEDVQTGTVTEPDTSKVETESETTAPPTETMIPLAAKQAEKERRKQAERERDDYRLELARLQGMQQGQVKTEPVEVPDPYTDPEGYTKFVVNQQSQKQKAESDQQLRARLASAEEVARVELTEYDKYAEYFAKNVAPNNPQAIEMMKASPDPARYAYYKGKQAMDSAAIQTQINDAGGLEAFETALRAKITAELAGKPEDPKIPPDLTSVRNAGGEPTGDNISEGTDGLNQLLGR